MSKNWLLFLVVGIIVEEARNDYLRSQSQITPKYCRHNNFTLHEVSLLFCAYLCVVRDGCRVVTYEPTCKACMGCQYVMDQDYSLYNFSDVYDMPVEIPADYMVYLPDTSSYNYIGCYADCYTNLSEQFCRGLALPQLYGPGTSLTTDQCFEICQQYGSRYFGTQLHDYCFCGQVYDKFGATDRCNSSCGGNDSQTCGGFAANSVYEILLRE